MPHATRRIGQTELTDIYHPDGSITEISDDGTFRTMTNYNVKGLLDGGVIRGRRMPALMVTDSITGAIIKLRYFRNGRHVTNRFGIHEVTLARNENYPKYVDTNLKPALPRRISWKVLHSYNKVN